MRVFSSLFFSFHFGHVVDSKCFLKPEPPSPTGTNESFDDQPCDLRLLTPATCLREIIVPPAVAATAVTPIIPATPYSVNTDLLDTVDDESGPTGGGNTTTGSGGGSGGSNSGGAFMCKQCGNSYARPHSLNRHIRFECGVEPKFECPICHKKSKHKHNLVLHMRTHQHR